MDLPKSFRPCSPNIGRRRYTGSDLTGGENGQPPGSLGIKAFGTIPNSRKVKPESEIKNYIGRERVGEETEMLFDIRNKFENKYR